MTIEKTILTNLIHNEDYSRKVINFIQEDYFSETSQKEVFKLIKNYFNTHNSNPNKTILSIDLENLSLSADEYNNSKSLITEISFVLDKKSEAWLISATEKFCKDRALINAIRESISIVDSSNNVNQIPSLLTSALGISFNKNVGHDFFEDYEKRFALYSESVQRVPFSLQYMNTITRGGFANKTLNLLLAPTNSGKSLVMCDFAASNVRNGYNALYITMEMAEEKIAQRIDANLLDISLDDFDDMPESVYFNLIKSLKNKYIGKLIVKEFATGSASVIDFKSLLEELRVKKNFIPDIIYIDYMNICSSSRMKNGGNNSYGYQKAIAEELRGMAVEYNVPIVSAIQSNRCLSLDTKVETETETKNIKNLQVGEKIKTFDGYVKVLKIYDINKEKTYKIRTKSGKEIICSNKHIFPTEKGMLSIENGLNIGDKFFISNSK